jgi:GTP-binding protein LepA
LSAIIERVPAPKGSADEPLQALIFDSVYNPFRGVETYFRILNGTRFQKDKKFNLLLRKTLYNADEIGTLETQTRTQEKNRVLEM